ncbi:hypothetical protein BC332_20240 [Capsicum chinense]|nr:hypothetical protein BC332_20240 [Capsicum chinense]
MTQLEMVVIDEAAQLKECESTIPLQLLGLCDAILIEDDKQLPAMTAGSGAGIEEEDNGDSIFHFDEDDEDEDAILAAIEELFERSW